MKSTTQSNLIIFMRPDESLQVCRSVIGCWGPFKVKTSYTNERRTRLKKLQKREPLKPSAFSLSRLQVSCGNGLCGTSHKVLTFRLNSPHPLLRPMLKFRNQKSATKHNIFATVALLRLVIASPKLAGCHHLPAFSGGGSSSSGGGGATNPLPACLTRCAQVAAATFTCTSWSQAQR